jgi:hypothetical protein
MAWKTSRPLKSEILPGILREDEPGRWAMGLNLPFVGRGPAFQRLGSAASCTGLQVGLFQANRDFLKPGQRLVDKNARLVATWNQSFLLRLIFWFWQTKDMPSGRIFIEASRCKQRAGTDWLG